MAASDARPVAIKNQKLRITFALRLSNGSLSSGAAGLDSEVSIDGGTFTDCTNEATEIATSSGIYYLDLEAAEMNGATIAVIVKSSTTGAVTYDTQLYPINSGAAQIPVDVDTINTSATAATAQKELADSAKDFTVDDATFQPTATDFETSLTTSVATGFYVGRSIIFITGNLKDQAARVTAAAMSNSKVKLTVTQLTAAPADGDKARFV